jgi:hypothetical protein
MADAATGIESVRVRRTLLAELDRIPLDDLDDRISAKSGTSTRKQVETRLAAVRTALMDGLPISDVSDGETFGKGYREGYAKPSREGLPNPPCTVFEVDSSFDLDFKGSVSAAQPALPGAELDLAAPVGAKIAPAAKRRRGIEDGPEFSEFWSIYPRKASKPAARKAWQGALNRGASANEIIEATKKHREFHEWKGTGMDYIPHAATWLNNENYDGPSEYDEMVRWNSMHKPQAPGDQKVIATLAKRTGDTSQPSLFAATLFADRKDRP